MHLLSHYGKGNNLHVNITKNNTKRLLNVMFTDIFSFHNAVFHSVFKTKELLFQRETGFILSKVPTLSRTLSLTYEIGSFFLPIIIALPLAFTMGERGVPSFGKPTIPCFTHPFSWFASFTSCTCRARQTLEENHKSQSYGSIQRIC